MACRGCGGLSRLGRAGGVWHGLVGGSRPGQVSAAHEAWQAWNVGYEVDGLACPAGVWLGRARPVRLGMAAQGSARLAWLATQGKG